MADCSRMTIVPATVVEFGSRRVLLRVVGRGEPKEFIYVARAHELRVHATGRVTPYAYVKARRTRETRTRVKNWSLQKRIPIRGAECRVAGRR
jgi:hypothetical protein